jgi:hypothetical protein
MTDTLPTKHWTEHDPVAPDGGTPLPKRYRLMHVKERGGRSEIIDFDATIRVEHDCGGLLHTLQIKTVDDGGWPRPLFPIPRRALNVEKLKVIAEAEWDKFFEARGGQQ